MSNLLRAVAALTDAHRAEIAALIARSAAHDGRTTELFLASPSQQEPGETCHFLRYDGDALVGIVALTPGAEVEATGLVDPAWRRRGIGRALLDAARDECRRRGAPHLLLTVDGASASGVAFAEALGATHGFSEHALAWEPQPTAQTDASIALEPAGADQVDTLARVYSAAFGDPETEARTAIERWLRDPQQRLFLGWRGGEAVGLIRAGLYDGVLYLATFGVVPERRRSGFGRAILTQAIRAVEPEGKPILLEVETDNDAALALYHACGFRPQRTYRYDEVPA